MSSAGRAVNSNGCVTKPKGREIGLQSCFVQIRSSSLTGSYVMETAEQREPYESRGSRTVLGEPGGESPPGHSTVRDDSTSQRRRQLSPKAALAAPFLRSRGCAGGTARAAGRALLYDRAAVAERERYWWARRTERLLSNLQSDDRGIFVEHGSALVADGRTPKRPP